MYHKRGGFVKGGGKLFLFFRPKLFQPVDRIPFWPKVDAAYLKRHGAAFDPEGHDAWFGSDGHQYVPPAFREERSRTSVARTTAHLERELAPLPHTRGIVLTSAGVMPPFCPPETIREVCRWIRARKN